MIQGECRTERAGVSRGAAKGLGGNAGSGTRGDQRSPLYWTCLSAARLANALLTALAAQPRDCPEVQLCLSYFRTHRERMRYPEFRAQGLCVGSGVVEAACQSIVGSRLKRSGMH